MIQIKSALCMGAVLFLITPCFAKTASTVASDLDTFVQGLGFSSNTTSPQAFESQASGYFGGGSLYARNQVREYQLVTIDLPSVSSSCSGIDLHLGGLSYISSAKLVELGKSIMASGGAYAVDVMLASTVPSLKSTRDFLQAAAQKATQGAVNSCELAQNFVGGIWPKTAASQQKICNDQRRMGREGKLHDYVTARMDCAGEAFKDSMKTAVKAHHPEVVINKNIVWSLLQDNPLFKDNQELSEMVMSLTGTYIIDANGKVSNIPSLLASEDLIGALTGASEFGVPVKGGAQVATAKVWRCTESNNCLNVLKKDIAITFDNSLKGQVSKTIHSIDSKLKSDTELTSAEKDFLSHVSLPVMKFLTVLNATQYGNAAVDMDEYATLIAQDLMEHYLSGLLEMVSQATQASALNEALLHDIQKRIETASRKVVAINPRIGRKLAEKLTLIENVSRIEKQLAASLSTGLS